jgi:hypothetical protein
MPEGGSGVQVTGKKLPHGAKAAEIDRSLRRGH